MPNVKMNEDLRGRARWKISRTIEGLQFKLAVIYVKLQSRRDCDSGGSEHSQHHFLKLANEQQRSIKAKSGIEILGQRRERLSERGLERSRR